MAQNFVCVRTDLYLGKYFDKPLTVKDVIWGHGFQDQYSDKVAELFDIEKGRNLFFILGSNRKEKTEGEEQGKSVEPP